MAEDPPPLLAWSFAGFHVALLVSLLVVGGYLAGAAGDLLAGLETAIGLALYGYLWIVTWWTNRRWLETVELELEGRSALRNVVAEAMRWGGATGLLFLAAPGAIAAGAIVVGGGLDSIPFVLLIVLIGGLLAAVVGAVVGGLFALLDLVVLGASGVIMPVAPPDPADTPGAATREG